MGLALQTLPDIASGAIATCREDTTVLEIVATFRDGQKRKWFPKLAQIISRTKPAQYIAHLTNERERTAYDWCAGEVDPPARVLIKLLHSPVGEIVIEEIMRGSAAKWWIALQEDRVHGKVRREVERQIGMQLSQRG